jgi:hypothetical protein
MEDLLKALQEAGEAANRKAELIVMQSASNVRNAVVDRINRGPASGRVYTRTTEGGGKKTHQASKAGEAPAADDGNLAGSYKRQEGENSLTQYVSSNLKYSRFLEFGTTRMAARPHLLPSLEEETPNFRRNLERLIQ